MLMYSQVSNWIVKIWYRYVGLPYVRLYVRMINAPLALPSVDVTVTISLPMVHATNILPLP